MPVKRTPRTIDLQHEGRERQRGCPGTWTLSDHRIGRQFSITSNCILLSSSRSYASARLV